LAATLAGVKTANAAAPATADWFFDLHRMPDLASAYGDADMAAVSLERQGTRWQASGIEVRTETQASGLAVYATVASMSLTRIHLRWKTKVGPTLLFMGDAWERSYGDLAWRTMVPERVMPWYFAAHDATAGVTHGYGVMTGAAAFCFWQVDPEGVSLWLDVSNGGMGVMLGQRELHAATVVSRQGHAGEHPSDAIAELCRQMCPKPRLPEGPVYGTNDWYYAYGNNTAEGILRDTELVAELAPKGGTRPFSVIDMGWEGSAKFPDMAKLNEEIRSRGVRPGIWIRPTLAPAGTKPELLLPMKHFRSPGTDLAYDPTVPEALQAAIAKMKQVVDWKYDLVKHDFSTFDLLGQWGFEMGATPTVTGWSFHDRSRTNAEIVLDYYKALRAAAGEATLLLGCNTVSHLAAGVFEMQRTGDDTSGKIWERTRRMGVNTLAYRLPQEGTFYSVDADCVGITKAVPWELNRQWMDLLARSGTGLFLSPSPDAIGPEQRAAIKESFAIAASGESHGRATDWFRETTPEDWEFKAPKASGDAAKRYDWFSAEGAYPYPI
jgi:alpha-galactosidase